MSEQAGIFIRGIDDLLMDFAGRAAQAASGRGNEAWEHGGHSVTSIILAAASVEAHVGEWLAADADAVGIPSEDREDWIQRKLSVADVIKEILALLEGRKAGDLPWFGRLKALLDLRNHVVHYYPTRRPVGTWPEKLEPWIQNGTLRPGGDETMDWTSRLLIADVATQSIQIAEDAMAGFDEVVVTEAAKSSRRPPV